MCQKPDCILDVDECMEGSDDCNVNANCTNTDGGFTCSCLPGYVGDGVIDCSGAHFWKLGLRIALKKAILKFCTANQLLKLGLTILVNNQRQKRVNFNDIVNNRLKELIFHLVTDDEPKCVLILDTIKSHAMSIIKCCATVIS